MKVSVQLHAKAALAPGKEPAVPTEHEAGWVPELDGAFWTNLSPLQGFEPRIVQQVT